MVTKNNSFAVWSFILGVLRFSSKVVYDEKDFDTMTSTVHDAVDKLASSLVSTIDPGSLLRAASSLVCTRDPNEYRTYLTLWAAMLDVSTADLATDVLLILSKVGINALQDLAFGEQIAA